MVKQQSKRVIGLLVAFPGNVMKGDDDSPIATDPRGMTTSIRPATVGGIATTMTAANLLSTTTPFAGIRPQGRSPSWSRGWRRERSFRSEDWPANSKGSVILTLCAGQQIRHRVERPFHSSPFQRMSRDSTMLQTTVPNRRTGAESSLASGFRRSPPVQRRARMRLSFIRRSLVAAVGLWIAGGTAELANGADDGDRVDFAREVLPILSDKCFVCHGPDEHGETDLRIDSLEAASEDRGGYRAIDPAHPMESEILARIASTDDPMPPVDADKGLSDAERRLLTRWIEQGGEYALHWALVPPQKQSEDSAGGDDYNSVAQAIDAMIEAPLAKRGLDLAPLAERTTLARRAALVLTGLPPEAEQLDEYLADESDEAYARFVDRLLASPRFGEHQARYWLDAVRYGDTHGLHLDNRRGIYPYRDWVVRAFNANLPLDDFITWQLAGDLIPDASLDQRVATGFVRLNPSTGEGGAIPAEFQMKNNFDRVENLGTVFLGLSLTCARCHTHKYDPIEQSEYFELLAFFNSTAEPSMDGNSYTYGPTVQVPPDQAAWQRLRRLEREADELIERWQPTAIELSEASKYAKQCADWSMKDWRISKPQAVKDDKEQSEASQSGAAKPGGAKPGGAKPGGAKPELAEVGKDWIAIKGLPGVVLGRGAKGRIPGAGKVTWVSVEINVAEHQSLDVSFLGGDGSRLFLDDQRVETVNGATAESDTADAIAPDAPPFGSETPSVAFVNRCVLELHPGTHQLRIAVVGTDAMASLSVQLSNRWDRLAEVGRWQGCSAAERLRMMADPLGPFGRKPQQNWDSQDVQRAIELSDQLSDEASRFTTSLVAEELPQPRPTYLLNRGEYDQPIGDPLQPGTLSVLGEWPDDAPRNRLGLARWLTGRQHPLTSRVLVNRIWQRVFGHGLVRTPEDFGLQGQQPTHPELLDWLAVELMENGWNLKDLIRSMVLTRTFRQSSRWRDDLDDPENRLFARALSYRLDAEVLRDIGLWSSGLLETRMGGEGVKPYQPTGMWTALAHPASNTKLYERDRGDRLYRRSLYVYWKRTSPHPMMTLFDAPDRESSCVRRSRTSTPLQSLGMLNETQRIEIGRALAARLLREDVDDRTRINRLIRMLTCRDADVRELDVCMTLLERLKSRYSESPADAEKLLEVGDSPAPDSFALEELAAWSQLSTTILASDIAMMAY